MVISKVAGVGCPSLRLSCLSKSHYLIDLITSCYWKQDNYYEEIRDAFKKKVHMEGTCPNQPTQLINFSLLDPKDLKD